jgi:hypothetical protein
MAAGVQAAKSGGSIGERQQSLLGRPVEAAVADRQTGPDREVVDDELVQPTSFVRHPGDQPGDRPVRASREPGPDHPQGQR